MRRKGNKMTKQWQNDDIDMKRFRKDRNDALVDFVLTGNTKKVRAYCKKYGVPIPTNHRIFEAGIYKAVLVCTDISDDVKDTAFRKCIELGFSPVMRFTRWMT